MKKIRFFRKLEQGQIIPLVVAALFALIAMAALILDGGAIMVNRRQAQNAADAGALAGARAMCRGETTQIGPMVTYYTETVNSAELVEWHIDKSNVGGIEGLSSKGELVVTAGVEHDSFFAKIFGEELLRAEATGAAGCFPYQPMIVLPIAWACRPPAIGSDSEDCDILKLDYEDFEAVASKYITVPLPDDVNPTEAEATAISDELFALYGNQIYLIMESEFMCEMQPDEDPQTLVCDWVDDGIDRNQLESGGNRGWLNLEGVSSGSVNLWDWIEDGVSGDIHPHIWLNGIPGNRPPVYSSVETRLDEVVWIPVFNFICDSNPDSKPICYDYAHNDPDIGVPLNPGQDCIVVEGTTTTYYYHIVSFAPFVVTCARDQNKDECPGFTLAQESNPDPKKPGTSIIGDEILSLEGYFIDITTLPEGDDVHTGSDLGFYKAVLTR